MKLFLATAGNKRTFIRALTFDQAQKQAAAHFAPITLITPTVVDVTNKTVG